MMKSEEIITQNQCVDKYSVIKHSQLKWLKSQSSTVKELWIDCWLADSFGDRFELLDTDIDINSSKFRTAKKVLSDNQIFTFEAVYERLPNGQNKLIGWKVKNCCNVKQLKHTTKRETNSKQVVQKIDKPVQILDKVVQKIDNLEAESLTTASFDFPSISFSIQEKEIKNKEKTAKRGPVEQPKLKNQGLTPDQEAELKSKIPLNSNSVKIRIDQILGTGREIWEENPVIIDFRWEDIDPSVIKAGIAKNKYTQQQLEKAMQVSKYEQPTSFLGVWYVDDTPEDKV